MKARIIKCFNKDWWHHKHIGKEIEIHSEYSFDAYFTKDLTHFGGVIPKKDCEIIK